MIYLHSLSTLNYTQTTITVFFWIERQKTSFFLVLLYLVLSIIVHILFSLSTCYISKSEPLCMKWKRGCQLLKNTSNILKQRRLELGLSQQAVATELKMHIRQYQRFEYGEQSLASCSMRTGLRICALLQLDPFEVVFSEDSPSRR